jgi:hypothetical protein
MSLSTSFSTLTDFSVDTSSMASADDQMTSAKNCDECGSAIVDGYLDIKRAPAVAKVPPSLVRLHSNAAASQSIDCSALFRESTTGVAP